MYCRIRASAPPDQVKIEDAVNTLALWFSRSAQFIRNNAPSLKEAAKCEIYTMPHDEIDFGVLSRKDMDPLRKALEELHEVCLKANFSLQVKGFDILPSKTATHSSHNIGDKEFAIVIDPVKGYELRTNPYSSTQDLHSTHTL